MVEKSKKPRKQRCLRGCARTATLGRSAVPQLLFLHRSSLHSLYPTPSFKVQIFYKGQVPSLSERKVGRNSRCRRNGLVKCAFAECQWEQLVLQLARGFESTVISKLILGLWAKRHHKFSLHKLCSELCFLLTWQEGLKLQWSHSGCTKAAVNDNSMLICKAGDLELVAAAAAQKRSLALPGRPCLTRWFASRMESPQQVWVTL